MRSRDCLQATNQIFHHPTFLVSPVHLSATAKVGERVNSAVTPAAPLGTIPTSTDPRATFFLYSTGGRGSAGGVGGNRRRDTAAGRVGKDRRDIERTVSVDWGCERHAGSELKGRPYPWHLLIRVLISSARSIPTSVSCHSHERFWNSRVSLRRFLALCCPPHQPKEIFPLRRIR